MIALLAAATPAVAQRGYWIEDLMPLNGLGTGGYAIASDGRVAGSSADLSGRSQGVIWSTNRPRRLALLPETLSASALGISSSGGFVVGWVDTKACLWRDGVPQRLDVPGDSSSAVDVNDREQVVGNIRSTLPFLWESGQARQLPLLGGSRGLAEAINNAGLVVGHSTTDGRGTHPVMWVNDQVIDLTGREGYAFDINNLGQIVGYSYQEGAFLWRNGQYELIPGVYIPAAINDQGQIVGSNEADRAILYDIAAIDLNDFLSACDPVDVLDTAVDIDDAGRIVARGYIERYQARIPRAVRMTPFSCGDIARLDARCRRGGQRVIARLQTALPEGWRLRLMNDLSDCRTINIDGEGRGRAVWKGTGPTNFITVAECPDVFGRADCE